MHGEGNNCCEKLMDLETLMKSGNRRQCVKMYSKEREFEEV